MEVVESIDPGVKACLHISIPQVQKQTPKRLGGATSGVKCRHGNDYEDPGFNHER